MPPHTTSAAHRGAVDPAARKPAAPASKAKSVIDAWLRITGDVSGESEIQVDGKVDGNVTCTQIVVGEGGAVSGIITADQVIVRGAVRGTIRADVVILLDSARVEGEILHRMLTVENGAVFDGQSRSTRGLEATDGTQPANAARGAAMPSANGIGLPLTGDRTIAGNDAALLGAHAFDTFGAEMDRIRSSLRARTAV